MSLEKSLLQILPAQRIKTRLIDRISYASDAGFYKLIPQAIVQPQTITEIQGLFSVSRALQVPLTFRAGGTSLSGQSISDGILVDLSQHWRSAHPINNGLQVRVQPGVIGAVVNAYLKKYGRKIGPDPSSIGSAMMGGILSNNSSGMCCGVHLNSYHTLKHIKAVLPDGQAFDTEIPGDYHRFLNDCKPLSDQLIALRQRLLQQPELVQKIRKKYLTKNTVGYSLNALLDYDHPLDIYTHLLIGGEGTLGFIAEAVLDTVHDYPCKATTFLYFDDIYAACHAIIPLRESGAEALELMDRASLRSIEAIKGAPDFIKSLPPNAAALLVEYQDLSVENISTKIANATAIISQLSLLHPPSFTQDAYEQALYWKLRKGMFPSVGAIRAQGTTVILEDIAFPVDKLAEAVADIQSLFVKYQYHNAIIFGHAKDGNLHFVITQSFNSPEQIARYEAFMDEIVHLVVHKYDGALKAEHGTGRNMAPFVETEWGAEAYEMMKIIKDTVDPDRLLNPGVIINNNPKAHVSHLKSLPVVELEVDKCIECGACEPKCPSKDITLTPRRRIVVRRELAQMKADGDKKSYKNLLQQYQYDGLDTCAVDGLCATDCPVEINTGSLVKRLRKENHSATANMIAHAIAKNFALAEILIKTALFSGNIVNRVFGKSAMHKMTKAIRLFLPGFPLWHKYLGTPPKIHNHTADSKNYSAVYFPTCITRLMGSDNSKTNIAMAFHRVSSKAGMVLKTVRNTGFCCGQAFSSKGYSDAYTLAANRAIAFLWEESLQGALPVILDVSSCTQTLQSCRGVLSDTNLQKYDAMRILDTIDYLHDFILPNAKIAKPKNIIALHPVCSLQKMGLSQKFENIARHFAVQVHTPIHAGCCGMAGDRGFLFPELTQAATAPEATEVKQQTFDGYYSTAKTCEMAISEAVGKNYESLIVLADEVMLP